MKGVLVIIFSLFILLLAWEPWERSEESHAIKESFDNVTYTVPGQAIVDHPLTHLVPSEGMGETQALKVEYQGFDQGSRRVVATPHIPRADVYEISFWVQFCEGFDFARGGKLHGLGPAHPVAGGNEITPEGWSARLMFRGDGGLQTYVYHQDMGGKYGDTSIAPNFTFQPGQYHHVVMQVILNAPADEANGLIKVWVDDALLIEHQDLRFRDRLTPESEIQRLMFNTFHGGSSPEWAPRTADGIYKTDCAFFDNIALTTAFER